MDLSSNIYNTLLELCSLKSTSGTSEELSAAKGIYSIISEIDYFKKNPENLRLQTIEGDPYKREFLSALYKNGDSRKTVVLISHFDVVGTEEFGGLKELAFDPVEYTRKLKYENIPEDVMDDLSSGNYLFGRGVMDMKCGLAIQIELLRYLSSNEHDLEGNVLLLTVPDEENISAGMLSAVKYLSHLKDSGYEFQGVINCEPAFPEYPGDDKNYIYTGTIGKLLPFIFFAGIEAHSGSPFNGISSALMCSITTSLIEDNTELCEAYGEYTAPPPVCLKQGDLKSLYSVSMPGFSYAYYNYMTLTSSPEEVINNIRRMCYDAFDAAIGRIKEQSEAYSSMSGRDVPEIDIEPNVITYDELCSIVANKDIHIEDIRGKYKDSGLDPRDTTKLIIAHMLKLVPELRPVMVVCFAPPYYPQRIFGAEFRKIQDTADKLIKRADKLHGQEVIQRDVFPGLCDLSYLGIENIGEYEALRANMPVFDLSYSLPIKELSNLNIGGINISVRGKDAHRYTERLDTSYSLKVTPDLVYFAIKELLD